jgi:hypothetical protein
MGLKKGLKQIREQAERSGGQDFEKVNWLQLKDGDTVRIRFAQELDEDSKFYDEAQGLGFVASEVVDPDNFRKKCLSTLEDEGRCFGLEMHKRLQGTEGYNGGWKPRYRLYINVLVTDGGEKKVALLSQGLGPKSISPSLLDAAEEYGSITNREWKISRKGSGAQNTSYTLTPLDRDDEKFDFSEYTLYDLEKVAVRHVPYEDQAEFFGYAEATDSDSDDGVSDTTEW